MSELPIYLDYMATTPIDPLVLDAMLPYMRHDGLFGNAASSTHIYGKLAADAIDKARQQIASSIHAEMDDIVFTSGATEANNLAILGAARFYQRKGKHLITMQTEHKAVLDSFEQLEKEGFTVSYLAPRPDGLLDLDKLQKALRADTILVSIMHVNNETGVIQDIAAIAKLVADRGIIFHVDAAQSAGKVAINVNELGASLMAFSAHKNYGPKGVGALYIRNKPRIRLQPQTFGGGHERGLRSGTLATHQIVGMGEAFALSESLRLNEQARLLQQRQKIWTGIQHINGIHLNGHPTARVAANLNIGFNGMDGESLLFALRELAISTTSACASASGKASYVLKAMGLSEQDALSSIRLSLGRFTTDAQIDSIIAIINQNVMRLQDMAP